ncbi:MAG: hypothetical protein R3C09_19690 [Pirellulaceae bacterium]
MVDRDMLLADLVRLATKHKDYSGTVERDEQDGFRLRFYPKPDDAMIEDRRVAWNEGVRALDSVSPRVIQFLNENSITTQSGETPGASVMAWVLQGRFPANRLSAFALTNAFDAVREALLKLDSRDFADQALMRLHRHDKFEERVRQADRESREAHVAQLEKLKNACCRLKEAIKAHNEALHQEVATASGTGHLAHIIFESLAVIDELGLGPILDKNALRKDKQLLSGQLEPSQIGYIKDELRLHLLLIKCRNITEQEITTLVSEIGHLSPSSCDDLWIDLWHYEQLEDVVEERQASSAESMEPAAEVVLPTSSETTVDSTVVPVEVPPIPFAGGNLVFYLDRVELCGVDICSGVRSRSRRITLELLAKQDDRGQFVFYGGDDLEDEVAGQGGKGTSAGLIRDLRSNIAERLRSQANMVCDPKAIILSGGAGYRLSHILSVQWAEPPNCAISNDITDKCEHESALDVGDGVGNNAAGDGDVVGNNVSGDGDDGGNDVASDGDDGGNEVATRKAWILEQLAEGKKLKAGSVADHFNCSMRTAERALTSLKSQGMIDYVGNPRTGYYRLVQSTQGEK